MSITVSLVRCPPHLVSAQTADRTDVRRRGVRAARQWRRDTVDGLRREWPEGSHWSSSSTPMWLAVVCSPAPVGIDVIDAARSVAALELCHFLHPAEHDLEGHDLLRAVATKEAVMKLRGVHLTPASIDTTSVVALRRLGVASVIAWSEDPLVRVAVGSRPRGGGPIARAVQAQGEVARRTITMRGGGDHRCGRSLPTDVA